MPDWFAAWLAECPMPVTDRIEGINMLANGEQPLPVQFKRLWQWQKQELKDNPEYYMEALRNEKH